MIMHLHVQSSKYMFKYMGKLYQILMDYGILYYIMLHEFVASASYPAANCCQGKHSSNLSTGNHFSYR